MNLVLAGLFTIPMMLLPADTEWLLAVTRLVMMQFALAMFNLLPIPPMDGSHMLACAHRPLRSYFDSWGAQYGMILPVIIGWPLFTRWGWPWVFRYIHWVRPEAFEVLRLNWS